MFNYFVCGVRCSEVEIDCLTGDHQVLRVDIVMDVGKSLNPAIDIGQIEGAFMQGYGMFLLEHHRTSPSGSVLTRGPGSYRIPSVKNIPAKLNVTLLKDSANTRAVYSSKGIGEPPLCLASSAFFAVKDAIRSARKDAGYTPDFRLDSPATAKRIRMACEDRFTKQFPVPDEESHRPWFAGVLGKILSELAVDGRTGHDMSMFSITRDTIQNPGFKPDFFMGSGVAAKL